jgi:hypothetical protein
VECGHAPEVLRLRSPQSDNLLYFHFVAFVSFMFRNL